MKIPTVFVPDSGLEEKTEKFLRDHEEVVVINSYRRIRYSKKGNDYILEYGPAAGKNAWALWDKEAYEVKWYRRDIDSAAEEVLECLLHPVVELLGLKGTDYSLKKSDAKTLLKKFAVEDVQKRKRVNDKLYGKGRVNFYKYCCKVIKLREFYELDWNHHQSV